MENEVKIFGKFYMKSGVVIEEEVILDKDNDKEVVENFIKDIKYKVKEGFREDYNFQFTFGHTMFRGKDISAITLTAMQ